METKEFRNLSEEINRLSLDLNYKIAKIIEDELKLVAEKYVIDSKYIKLAIHPIENNLTLYEISIKVASFTIENKFINSGKDIVYGEAQV